MADIYEQGGNLLRYICYSVCFDRMGNGDSSRSHQFQSKPAIDQKIGEP